MATHFRLVARLDITNEDGLMVDFVYETEEDSPKVLLSVPFMVLMKVAITDYLSQLNTMRGPLIERAGLLTEKMMIVLKDAMKYSDGANLDPESPMGNVVEYAERGKPKLSVVHE